MHEQVVILQELKVSAEVSLYARCHVERHRLVVTGDRDDGVAALPEEVVQIDYVTLFVSVNL